MTAFRYSNAADRRQSVGGRVAAGFTIGARVPALMPSWSLSRAGLPPDAGALRRTPLPPPLLAWLALDQLDAGFVQGAGSPSSACRPRPASTPSLASILWIVGNDTPARSARVFLVDAG